MIHLILEDYKTMPGYQICEKYKITRLTLVKILEDNNIEVKKRWIRSTKKKAIQHKEKVISKLAKPSKEELETKYLKNQISIVGLSEMYGVSRTTIRNWLKEYDIPRRDQYEASLLANKQKTNPGPAYDQFYQDYMVEKLPIHEIYKKWHIAQPRVYELIKKYGLPERNQETHSLTHSTIKKRKWISRMPSKEEVELVYSKTKNITSTRDQLGISDYSMRKLLKEYDIDTSVPWRSNAEISLYEFCKETRPDLKWVHSDKTLISPYELDIVCHELKIAIEYCGIYWHSEISGGKDRNYHLKKMIMCQEKGYELITVFETDPIDIVKSIIAIKLGVSQRLMARKCSVTRIHSKIATQFHLDNHIHGSVNASHHYGLIYNGDLVYVASFGKNRFSKNETSWECTRMSGAKGITVAGGPSRLFKKFHEENPGPIVTFADRRFGSGKNYSHYMEALPPSGPNYRYFHKDNQAKLFSRNVFQKHKLKNLPIYDENMTEWEIMQANGYDRIWDCGNAKFILK